MVRGVNGTRGLMQGALPDNLGIIMIRITNKGSLKEIYITLLEECTRKRSLKSSG